MNSYWFDVVQIPANAIIDASEEISSQGWHIVSVVNLNMVAQLPGSLLQGDGKPQVVPMVSIVARIARTNNLRARIKPKQAPTVAS